MTDTKIALSITTKVKPPKKLLVDGVEYDLLSLEHLDADTENTVMSLFSRHGSIVFELENAPDLAAGEKAAAQLKKVQNRIVCLMTTMPRDVVEKLPMSAKAKLFGVVAAEYQYEEDDEREDPRAGNDSDL